MVYSGSFSIFTSAFAGLSSKMWVGISEFVRAHRVVFFTGPFGAGKTLGAVALGWELYHRGYVVVSNIPILFSSPIRSLRSLHKIVFILDEGRRDLDARLWKSRDLSIDYLRHLDSYLLISSAFDVDSRLRRLTLERFFRYSLVASLPELFWFYRAILSDVPSPKPAVLLAPRAYFGLYPHKHLLSPDEDLFFSLLMAIFERLSYKPPELSQEDLEWVETVVSQ